MIKMASQRLLTNNLIASRRISAQCPGPPERWQESSSYLGGGSAADIHIGNVRRKDRYEETRHHVESLNIGSST